MILEGPATNPGATAGCDHDHEIDQASQERARLPLTSRHEDVSSSVNELWRRPSWYGLCLRTTWRRDRHEAATAFPAQGDMKRGEGQRTSFIMPRLAVKASYSLRSSRGRLAPPHDTLPT